MPSETVVAPRAIKRVGLGIGNLQASYAKSKSQFGLIIFTSHLNKFKNSILSKFLVHRKMDISGCCIQSMCSIALEYLRAWRRFKKVSVVICLVLMKF